VKGNWEFYCFGLAAWMHPCYNYFKAMISAASPSRGKRAGFAATLRLRVLIFLYEILLLNP
jgi:hypothetical protein